MKNQIAVEIFSQISEIFNIFCLVVCKKVLIGPFPFFFAQQNWNFSELKDTYNFFGSEFTSSKTLLPHFLQISLPLAGQNIRLS